MFLAICGIKKQNKWTNKTETDSQTQLVVARGEEVMGMGEINEAG